MLGFEDNDGRHWQKGGFAYFFSEEASHPLDCIFPVREAGELHLPLPLIPADVPMERTPPIERWMRKGLVHVGVAIYLNDGDDPPPRALLIDLGSGHSTARAIITNMGSGILFDQRGLILTCEHVRHACESKIRHAGQGRAFLVACPYTQAKTDWSYAWIAEVISHTAHWDSTENTLALTSPGATTISKSNADAAVLRATRLLCSREEVTSPIAAPARPDVPLPCFSLDFEKDYPEMTQRLWCGGFPAYNHNHVVITSGEYAGEYTDESGRWTLYNGQVNPGDSGGPVIDALGEVVAWNVRNVPRHSGAAGINHLRHIGEARACVQAALERIA